MLFSFSALIIVFIFSMSLFFSFSNQNAFATTNIVTNGSFEVADSDCTGSFTTLPSGNTALTDWTIGGVSIDWICGGHWSAQDGTKSLDLSGDDAGSISQYLSTESGTGYDVEFYMSGNTDGGNTEKTMTVTAPNYDHQFTYDTTGNPSGTDWQLKSFSFTATNEISTLTFTSNDANAYGAALDNVSVVKTNPTVVSKTVNDSLISDSDDPSTFDVVVIFSEVMDNAVTPTITFSTDVSSTLSFASGAWSDGDTVYVATYDIADAGVTETSVTFTVSSAKDSAGNDQVTDETESDTFAIDTENPTGTFVIERNDATIDDSVPYHTYDRHVILKTTCDDLVAESGCESLIFGEGLSEGTSEDFGSISDKDATLTEFRDLKEADVTLRDDAGNTTTLYDTIWLDAKIINITVTDDTPYWDQDVTFGGTVKNARPDDTITFDFGSPTVTGIVITGGDSSTFSVTDSYPKISSDESTNPHLTSVTLADSENNVVGDSNENTVTIGGPQVIVQPHPTSVILNSIQDPFGGDVFTATGKLNDDFATTGVAGKTIEFDGSGAVTSLVDTTTSGFTVTDSLGIVVDNVSADYILRAHTGLKIIFPSKPNYVTLSLQDMGFNTANVLVTPSAGATFTATGKGQGINTGIFTLTHPAGISSIEITGVSAGTAGITRIQTLNNDQVQTIDVGFGNTESGSSTSLSFESGSFASQGTSITTPAIDLKVVAHFDGDIDYDASDQLSNTSMQNYSVQYATAGGYGGSTSITTDSGSGITSVLCAAGNDNDGDALCNDWEGAGNGVPIDGGGVYPLSGSNPDKKDIYVEIDYMAGHDPFISGAINDVTTAFANAPVTNVAPATNGIVLHVEKGEQLTHTPITGVWIEFNALKAANFGKPSETANQKTARAQAYHYFVFAHSIGGSSGVAELKGNDGIVSLGEGFGETDTAHAGTEGTRNEIAGTFMHELGHQLNLNHGGPNIVSNADSGINCKPNHDSIMSYSRQLPNILGINWVLDYSNGGLGPPTGLRENGGLIPSAGNIAETNGNLVSLDNAITPGTDPLPWIIWGTPGQVQSYLIQKARTAGGTPADIDWNGNGVIAAGTNLAMDINGIGFFGCESSTTKSTVAFKNYNEWTALDYNFRQTPSGQFDGIQVLTSQDADSSINLQTRIASAIHQSLSPWNADSSITRNANSNVPIKVKFFDGQGLQIIGGQTTVTYKMYKSGSSQIVSQGNIPYELSDGHWHKDVKAPKDKGTYYITLELSNLGLPSKITKDPDNNPQFRNPVSVPGPLMSMKLIVT